jgi:hypothetical protein
VALSGLCLLHCLALSLAAVAAPVVVGLGFDGGWTHVAMLALVIPLSAVALPRGYREHRRNAVLWLGGAGLTLLVLGATLGHHVYGPAVDTVLTMAGAVVLGLAHVMNAVWCGRVAPRRREAGRPRRA